MSKKYYEPITVYENKDGEQVAKVRMIGMRQETATFIKWVRNSREQSFEIRPIQIKMLDAYFSLLKGEGKTLLANLLREYDEVIDGSLNIQRPAKKENEQFKIFQSAYILHKYFLKGNMRPIENFASMLVDIAKESDYENPAAEVKAVLSHIKSEIDKQIELLDIADTLNRGAEKGE